MEVTFETKAWMSDSMPIDPEMLKTPAGAGMLVYAKGDMTAYGYTQVGTASITLAIDGEPPSQAEMLRKKADLLRRETDDKLAAIARQIDEFEHKAA